MTLQTPPPGDGDRILDEPLTEALSRRYLAYALSTISSRALPDAVAIRLMKLAGTRVTDEGILVIKADRFRTQERNRDDARERLAELVREALKVPKRRIATKPTRAAKAKRIEGKKRRSQVKAGRRGGGWV